MGSTHRVLILEDSVSDADLIEFELQESGFDLTTKRVMKENEFVQALQEFSADLILSDYDLPQYNGALALAEAKRKCPEVPFILVTGAVGEDRAIEMLTNGAKDYVMKSRLHRLVPAVQRAFAEVAEQRARKQAEEALREAYKDLENQVEKRTAQLAAEITSRRQAEEDRNKLILELQEALANVKNPSGLLPLCTQCKRIRDHKGHWNKFEDYITEHSDAPFSQGMCPACAGALDPQPKGILAS